MTLKSFLSWRNGQGKEWTYPFSLSLEANREAESPFQGKRGKITACTQLHPLSLQCRLACEKLLFLPHMLIECADRGTKVTTTLKWNMSPRVPIPSTHSPTALYPGRMITFSGQQRPSSLIISLCLFLYSLMEAFQYLPARKLAIWTLLPPLSHFLSFHLSLLSSD